MRAPFALFFALVLVVLSLTPTVQAQTTEADVYVQEAVIDFDEKRYDAALQSLRKALQLEPDHPEALYYTGATYMAQGQPAEAIKFLLRARAKTPQETSIAFQLGLAYFALQQYDQAQPLLEEVFRAQPTLDGLGYYIGFMRYRKKEYRAALEAFRAGRTTDPDIQQLTRFYTGLALAILGLPTQAAAEVEQALRLAPGSPLTGPAERLRDTIVAARGKERRLSGELRLGAFYDSNVAVIPNRGSNEPLVGTLRTPRHESFGQLASLRLDYSWLKHFLKRDDWDANVGFTFFGTYNDEIPKFNVKNYLFNAGVTHRLSLGPLPVQLGVQYAWDILDLRQNEKQPNTRRDHFLSRNTVTAYGAIAEPAVKLFGVDIGNLTQIFGRYQSKFFDHDPGTVRAEHRDADNYTIGFVHLFRFQQDAHFIKLGYQFDYEDTFGRDFEYRGHRISVGGQYTLPFSITGKTGTDRGIRLKYDFDAHIRDYANKNAILPTTAPGTRRRFDEELTSVFRTEVPLGTTCMRKDDCILWTLAGEYQRTMANSNLAVFDYNRDVFSLILSLSY